MLMSSSRSGQWMSSPSPPPEGDFITFRKFLPGFQPSHVLALRQPVERQGYNPCPTVRDGDTIPVPREDCLLGMWHDGDAPHSPHCLCPA